MTYEIRDATPDDCDTIAALLSELNHEEGTDVISHPDEVTQALFTTKREVDVRALVAAEGETFVGVALYYPGYDTVSASYGHHLADIIVTREKRGQGIGRLLMQALAKRTLDDAKEWVSLTVLKRNDAAHEFYKALGMTQVSVHFFAAGKQALTQL